MNSGRPLPLLPAILSALTLAGGVLSYWALARTPIRPTSSSIEMAMAAVSSLLALATATVGLMAVVQWWRWRGAAWGRAAPEWAGGLAALPRWLMVLPVAMSASYVAARMGLTREGSASYWPALGLWLAGMALFLVSFAAVQRPGVLVPSARWVAWLRAHGWEIGLVLLLAAVALALRAVKVDAAPILAHVDEEAVGLETLNVLSGQVKNMFSVGWGGLASMVFFIHAPALKLLGEDIVSLRTTSAVVGAAAVPMMYLLLREMFGRGLALAGAVFLLGYHLHLHFSRVSVAYLGGDALAVAVPLYFAFRASRYQRPFDFGAAGLTAGLALYLSHGTRVVPLIVLAYLAYLTAFQRGFLRRNAASLSMTFLAFFLAAMPLGAYWLTDQAAFWARIGTVGIFQSGWFDTQVELGRSPLSILWDQSLHSFGGFVYYDDVSSFGVYDKAQPLVAGLAIVPFIAGFVYSLLHADDKRYALLLIAFVVPTVAGGVLTVGTPNSGRLLTTIPSVVGFVAVGLWQLSVLVLAQRKAMIGIVAIGAAAGLAALNAQFYFHAASTEFHYGGLEFRGTVPYVKALPADTRIYWFGAPRIWANFLPFSLHERNFIEVFDQVPEKIRPVQVPSPSVYLFLPEREGELAPLARKCPGGTTQEVSFRDAKILEAYELPMPNTCVPDLHPKPPNNDFADALTIIFLPFSDSLSTRGATTEPGEPNQPQFAEPVPGHPYPCGGTNSTVWYSFTPPADMPLVADTLGSSFNTILGVYTGHDVGSLTPVTCNDNFVDQPQSQVSFPARAGMTYYFQVAGDSFSAGDLTFNLAEVQQ